MINVDENYIKKSINFLDKQSIKIIQQNLEYYNELIFKNYKNDENLKEYKVKEFKTKTLITMEGRMTYKRRKYYKINPATKKIEYISILDKILGVEK